jgi:heterogeneous nuclear ribonucleoprotein R
MPRTRAKSATTAVKSPEPEKPAESEEHVDFEEDEDPEEIAEEVEYEEVEEEEEEEAEEEVEEEDEEEIEEVEEEMVEEVQEENEEDNEEDGSDDDDDEVEEKDENGVDDEKHNELLELPPHGSEVYLGGIPPDASEDDLKEFCESIGEVTEVRIMKGKESSGNKGYAFVSFRTKDMASSAIKDLNNTEFKGKKVKCSTSQAKHKLFIGNVPRSWTQEDMKKVVTKVGPGVECIELLKDPNNSGKNRGFAFIEYYNHACAEYSRQKMSNPKFKLDDNVPTISWADPPKNGDSSSNSQVKAVYVKNLPKNITQDQLKKLFDHHGKITKVVVPPAKAGQEKRRFGFIHFADRSCAMKALRDTEKYEINGQVLDCSFAKPQADQRSGTSASSSSANSHKSALLPTYPPRAYGLVGSPYGAIGAGYAQPMMYGGGPSAAGMAMMPMLLPDGRIGYVLQQPGVQSHAAPQQHHHHRGGGRNNRGGGRRNGGSDGGRGRGRRYNPY